MTSRSYTHLTCKHACLFVCFTEAIQKLKTALLEEKVMQARVSICTCMYVCLYCISSVIRAILTIHTYVHAVLKCIQVRQVCIYII